MKHIQLFGTGALAFVLVACGGSGGGTTRTATIISSTPRVEAVVLNPTSYDTGTDANGNPYSYLVQDPLDIEAQDQVVFELVNYTTSGNAVIRNILPTNNWSSSDSSSTYGHLAYDSGVFVANSGQNANVLTAVTYFQGQGYVAGYKVLPRQVRLRGQILADDTHVAVPGVEVDFYGPQNPSDPSSPLVLVGRVNSAYDGTFRASIPATATVFQLKNVSLPSAYQRYFRFEGSYYHTGDSQCEAPLPLFSNGERFLIDYTNGDVTTNGTILLVSSAESTPTSGQLACGG